MSKTQPPLTPLDCDLRGLEWMPLYGDRLFTSETWLMASPEGRCAALALWWAAWKQRPAGSLADHDRVLSQMAGYGTNLEAWLAIKAEAMRGWGKCSDGRLYHPIVCEFAIEAWDRRKKERQRKADYRAKNANNRGGTGGGQDAEEHPEDAEGQGGNVPPSGDGDVPGTRRGRGADRDVVVLADRTRQDRTGQDSKERIDSPPTPHLTEAAKPPDRRQCEIDDPEFSVFWAAYPRKDDKGHARKTWKAARKKADVPTIMAGLARYRFREDPEFRPLAATWLNGERWTDQSATLRLNQDDRPEPSEENPTGRRSAHMTGGF